MYAYSDRAIVALCYNLHFLDCVNQAENTTHTLLYPFHRGDFMLVISKLKGEGGGLLGSTTCCDRALPSPSGGSAAFTV